MSMNKGYINKRMENPSKYKSGKYARKRIAVIDALIASKQVSIQTMLDHIETLKQERAFCLESLPKDEKRSNKLTKEQKKALKELEKLQKQLGEDEEEEEEEED